MFWEQLHATFYQILPRLDTIPLRWYVAFFLAIIGITLIIEGQLKLVPNNRWRFGDKLK